MAPAFRLSRLRTPRCSPVAVALIVATCLLFGMAATRGAPADGTPDRSARGAPGFVISNWLPGR